MVRESYCDLTKVEHRMISQHLFRIRTRFVVEPKYFLNVTSGGTIIMSAEVGDVALIQDEDLLRRMWQQTEDFGRKKEIRARMYKLREQRLREFYTTGEVLSDVLSTSTSSLDGSKRNRQDISSSNLIDTNTVHR
ncbi:hypothetical protein C0J52_21876 [Blattella germanica]|nr:hypothetical protein C0J52_21876 [Blattella germanica]